MKISQTTVVSTVIGVILAGLAMRFGRNVPGLKDARMGFDGRAV